MINPIQSYDWGSERLANELFNMEGKVAELWMGAHKNGDSLIEINGENRKLSDYLSDNNRSLSFLFKVLFVEDVLSIQVHPNKENAKIFSSDSYSKNYLYEDDNHKPELLYALTDFIAMNGFKSKNEIIKNITLFDNNFLYSLYNDCGFDVCSLLVKLSGLDLFNENNLLNDIKLYCKDNIENYICKLIYDLFDKYNDISCIYPMFFNIDFLSPGDCLYISPGTPHAYVKGAALEVMANSDNVLRAGLTNKKVDIKEFVKNISLNVITKNINHFNNEDFFEYKFKDEEITFNIYNVEYYKFKFKHDSILFSIDAELTISDGKENSLIINKGESVFIQASNEDVIIKSSNRFAIVSGCNFQI